jgi:hypothetical protein
MDTTRESGICLLPDFSFVSGIFAPGTNEGIHTSWSHRLVQMPPHKGPSGPPLTHPVQMWQHLYRLKRRPGTNLIPSISQGGLRKFSADASPPPRPSPPLLILLHHHPFVSLHFISTSFLGLLWFSPIQAGGSAGGGGSRLGRGATRGSQVGAGHTTGSDDLHDGGRG